MYDDIFFYYQIRAFINLLTLLLLIKNRDQIVSYRPWMNPKILKAIWRWISQFKWYLVQILKLLYCLSPSCRPALGLTPPPTSYDHLHASMTAEAHRPLRHLPVLKPDLYHPHVETSVRRQLFPDVAGWLGALGVRRFQLFQLSRRDGCSRALTVVVLCKAHPWFSFANQRFWGSILKNHKSTRLLLSRGTQSPYLGGPSSGGEWK